MHNTKLIRGHYKEILRHLGTPLQRHLKRRAINFVPSLLDEKLLLPRAGKALERPSD